MRKLISIFLFLCSFTLVAQEIVPQFELSSTGVEPIVLQMDSLKAPDLYKKTLNWVQKTYKNPEKVLKANIPNEEIRVEGYKERAWIYKSLGLAYSYDLSYSFIIKFKDMKIRLEYIPNEVFASGRTATFEQSTHDWFKKDGTLRDSCKDSKADFENGMNELVSSLYKYLKGTKDDW